MHGYQQMNGVNENKDQIRKLQEEQKRKAVSELMEACMKAIDPVWMEFMKKYPTILVDTRCLFVVHDMTALDYAGRGPRCGHYWTELCWRVMKDVIKGMICEDQGACHLTQ